MNGFFETLKTQRWDDHRYYHHSRINQSLHLVSAISFLFAYVILFSDPVAASLIAWGIAMTSRQIGHFFFEPKTYDQVNQATHEYKESIKIGYNLRRKAVLTALWAAVPVALYLQPAMFGMLTPADNVEQYVRQVGSGWLVIGLGGLIFRTLQLFFLKDIQTGLVWMTKVLTDPFYDIKLYYKAPLHVLRGQLIEPNGQGNGSLNT
jgi:hypothetical protein